MPRGIDCILYRNSAALGAGYATPTWNVVGNVKDVQLSDTKESFDVTTRHERGVKVYEQTLSEIEVTGMIRQPESTATTGDPNYDDYIAIRDAYFGNSVLDMMALTGAHTVNGVIGLRGFWKVSEWTEDQSNSVALFNSFKLKPAPVDPVTLAATATAEAMRRVKITGAVPTYALFGSTTYA